LAVKRHKLDVAILEDFCLLGLMSDDADFKLCWQINQLLGTSFEKEDNLELYHKKLKADQQFSLFTYLDEDAMVTYRIIGNRSEVGYFLDELRNLDYLVHIQGEFMPEQIDDFISRLGTLESVRLCVPVDLGKIRNKDRLLLW
jgi:hypothetical protein